MNSKKNTLVYIMAPSYTGSTLLTYLMAMHPRIATIGELKASAMGDISKYHCSCGALIQDCTFWEKVCRAAREMKITFALDNFGTHFRSSSSFCDRLLHAGLRGDLFEAGRTLGIKFYPDCNKQFLAVMKQNQSLIELLMELQEKDIFLDGSKDPNRIKYFCGADHWDVKILYLIRDGRGAANSYMKHNNTTMEVAAKEWSIVHMEADRVAEMFPKKIKICHYEDLCSSPDKVLSDIFQFIGAGTEGVDTDFRSVEHHILGNSMRMISTSELNLDEKWKKELSTESLEIFDKMSGSLNRAYGYGF